MKYKDLCRIEQCYINAKEGQEVKILGEKVPKFLIKKTKEALDNLERVQITQKSDSI